MMVFSQEPTMDMVKSRIIFYILCDDRSQIINLIEKNVTEGMTTEQSLRKAPSLIFAFTFLEIYLITRTNSHPVSIDPRMCSRHHNCPINKLSAE